MRQPAATGATAAPSGGRKSTVTRHAIGAVWAAMLEAKATVAASSKDNVLVKNEDIQNLDDHICDHWFKSI